MFFLMISCFLLCWTPYAVVSMMVAFGRKSMVSPTVAVIPSFFAKSSTAYNPLIYIFMSRKVGFLRTPLAVSILMDHSQSGNGGGGHVIASTAPTRLS